MSEEAGHQGNKPDRELFWSALDEILAEARSRFADLTPEALESLIDEAVVAAQITPPVKCIDEGSEQAQWESLLDEVERGSRYIIMRGGEAVAVMIPGRHTTAGNTGDDA